MKVFLNHAKQRLLNGELALGMGLRQARTETRSGHCRTDHPKRNDAAFGRSFVQRQSSVASTFTPLAYAAE